MKIYILWSNICVLCINHLDNAFICTIFVMSWPMSHFCDIYNWISWKVIFFFFASVPFNNHCKNLRWMLATSIILQDEKFLIWYSGQREKQLRLSSVTKIVTGQRTVCSKCDFLMWILLVILHHTDALFIYMLVNYLWQINFQRQLQPDRELQSFSLIYANGECSLDLVIKLVGPLDRKSVV